MALYNWTHDGWRIGANPLSHECLPLTGGRGEPLCQSIDGDWIIAICPSSTSRSDLSFVIEDGMDRAASKEGTQPCIELAAKARLNARGHSPVTTARCKGPTPTHGRAASYE